MNVKKKKSVCDEKERKERKWKKTFFLWKLSCGKVWRLLCEKGRQEQKRNADKSTFDIFFGVEHRMKKAVMEEQFEKVREEKMETRNSCSKDHNGYHGI